MDTQTSILQTINQTTNSILEAVQAGSGSLPDNVVTTDEEQTLSNEILDNTNTLPDNVVTTDGEQTLTNKTIDGVSCNFSARYFTFQNKADTTTMVYCPNVFDRVELVGEDTAQTLSNKTLDDTNTFPDNVVITDGEQILSNKTLDDTNRFPNTLARTDDLIPFELYEFSNITRAAGFENSWLFGKLYTTKNVLILFGQIEVNYSATTKTLLDAGVLYTDGSTTAKFIIHTTPAVYIIVPNNSSSALTITNDDQLEGSFTFFAVLRGGTYTIGSSATQLI